MLPRNCYTSCAVPYLCVIACPLSERWDQFVPKPESLDEPIDPNAPLEILVSGDAETESPPPS